MSVRSLVCPFADLSNRAELRELAEAVRQGVLKGAQSSLLSTLILDKERFLNAFCEGIAKEGQEDFERRFPKGRHWYLRIRTGRTATDSFEKDCGREFAEFPVPIPGAEGQVYTFFSQLEDCSDGGGELLMRIVNVRPRQFVIPAIEGFSDALNSWECFCEIQGCPQGGDLGAFLEYMQDSHAFSFVQVLAEDCKTVIAAYGVREQWEDIFCGPEEPIRRSQEYISYLAMDGDEAEAILETWEEKLHWAEGWDPVRFKKAFL